MPFPFVAVGLQARAELRCIDQAAGIAFRVLSPSRRNADASIPPWPWTPARLEESPTNRGASAARCLPALRSYGTCQSEKGRHVAEVRDSR